MAGIAPQEEKNRQALEYSSQKIGRKAEEGNTRDQPEWLMIRDHYHYYGCIFNGIEYSSQKMAAYRVDDAGTSDIELEQHAWLRLLHFSPSFSPLVAQQGKRNSAYLFVKERKINEINLNIRIKLETWRT